MYSVTSLDRLGAPSVDVRQGLGWCRRRSCKVWVKRDIDRERAALTPSQRLTLEQADFSLVLGGPLYQFFRRSHLSGDTFELAARRIVVISLFAWLPLLLLSAITGELWGGATAVPFLTDVEVHVRLLVAMPLLILAELVVHRRMRLVVRQFLDRKLIPEDARPRFDDAIAAVMRLRNSTSIELLIALVYGVGVFGIWRLYAVLDQTAWNTVPAVEARAFARGHVVHVRERAPVPVHAAALVLSPVHLGALPLAGLANRAESRADASRSGRRPRLPLITAYAFVPLAVAHGAVLSGMIANRILHVGTSLMAFKVEIAVVVVFVQCLVFVPLLLFAPQLAQAKRNGSRVRHARRAIRARVRCEMAARRRPPTEALIGSADIQSLADLGNSFEVVRTMRAALVTRDAIVQLGIATLIPLAPLLLTIMPLEELVKKLFGILF